MSQNNIHSPKNFLPEDYNMVDVIYGDEISQEHMAYLSKVKQANEDRVESGISIPEAYLENARKEMEENIKVLEEKYMGYFGTKRPPQCCDHCGARTKYFAVLLHKPTGNYIGIGETCEQNRFSQSNAERMFEEKRKALERKKTKEERDMGLEKLAETNRDLADAIESIVRINRNYDFFLQDVCLELNVTTDAEKAIVSESFEMMNKIFTEVLYWARKSAYKKLSDKQINMLLGGYDKSKTFATNAIERHRGSIQLASVAEKLEGRVTVKGKVATVKEVESEEWGTSIKMMFVLASGQKIWCTCPGDMPWDDNGQVDKQNEYEIAVTVEQSDKDPMFYFGKRPKLKLPKA